MSKIFKAKNETIRDYRRNSKQRKSVQLRYDELSNKIFEIPLIIDGCEVKTKTKGHCVKPHDHKHILATYHNATKVEANQAIKSSLKAWEKWSETPFEIRSNIFLKAAKLLKGPWRDTINAATMLNQSKNIYQAEIDSACELIDFFNFNVQFANQIYSNQPLISPKGQKNYFEYRPLEGFIFAIAPFNFTSIAGNLPAAPVLMGNVAIWKPASSAVLPCYFIMQMLEEAGLPKGVINFLPGKGSEIGHTLLSNKNLAGVHFTGSTKTFQFIWKSIGENISNYKSYPRIVGETGGKDFCLAHESSNIDELITAMIRGAFEFQGQKCSAMSRAYIPTTIWEKVSKKYLEEVASLKIGSPRDFSNFINAVIDKAAFDSIVSYIEYAKNSKDSKIITGGTYNVSKGFFISPTTILTTNPHFKTMKEEIFGPVLTIFLYDPKDWNKTIDLVNSTSPYALTGCIMGYDKNAMNIAKDRLKHSAGNFYINDKPTGAVVGQQPFGGARASGTNDKAGSEYNLHRWVSIRTVKENFKPPKDYRYPFLDKD